MDGLEQGRLEASSMISRRVVSPRSRPYIASFAAVMLVSLVVRLIVLLLTSPVLAPDSIEYMHLARLIGQGRLAADFGLRPPGYSVFLLLHDFDPNLVRITQMALGLCITAGLYWLVWRFTASVWLASIGALLYGTNVAQIFFESSAVTETLATALLFGAVLLLVCLTNDSRVALKLVALGLAVGVVPLVRPVYVFVPVLFIFPAAGACRFGHRQRLLLYLLPAMLPVIMWVTFLGTSFDYFGLQTASGFAWTNHAGAYVQDAPDKYAVIRDIYLQHVATHHGHVNAIWAAIPEMEAATGQSYPQLSKTVQSMSLTLLAAHPAGYLGQVGHAFLDFWKGMGVVPGWEPARGLTDTLWKLSRYLGILVNVVFVLVVLGMVLRRVRLLRVPALPWPSVWMASVVLITAIAQAGVEYGDGRRFSMPTQPLVAAIVMFAVATWILKRPVPRGTQEP